MKFFRILLVILWMLLIFFFSNKNSHNSTNQSKNFIYTNIEVICRTFNIIIEEEKLEYFVETIELPIRKCAHVFLYCVLSILVVSLLKSYNMSYKEIFICTFLFCLLYSISDEIHQAFVPGRNGNIKDIFIDCIGIYTGIYISIFLKNK